MEIYSTDAQTIRSAGKLLVCEMCGPAPGCGRERALYREERSADVADANTFGSSPRSEGCISEGVGGLRQLPRALLCLRTPVRRTLRDESRALRLERRVQRDIGRCGRRDIGTSCFSGGSNRSDSISLAGAIEAIWIGFFF